MSKKVALVTGANKGIGFETAKQLAKEGITVIATSRDEKKGIEAVTALQNEGLGVVFLHLDVNSHESVESAYDFIADKYGKLDILVNNAGIQIESEDWAINTAPSITDDDLHQTFETNFFSIVKLTNKFLPLIQKSVAGRIVNLSSILGSLTLHSTEGSPIYGSKLFGYNSSKTALNAYTIHLAASLAGTNVKVNSAHPGWVKTELGTEAAPMSVEDGAKTSVALALLPADGPTGKFLHLGQELPW